MAEKKSKPPWTLPLGGVGSKKESAKRWEPRGKGETPIEKKIESRITSPRRFGGPGGKEAIRGSEKKGPRRRVSPLKHTKRQKK